ncbi:MAG: hypothetical protein ACI8QZ_003111 [Chlamydiales bacterium]|jgi:hypothetical protein
MKHPKTLPTRPFFLLSLLVGAVLTTSCGGGPSQGGAGQNQTDAAWNQFDWDEAGWS